tara:strand:- start:6009 stop:6245 length:237 start_codon:yes stop_codon:yes gene_type:complete
LPCNTGLKYARAVITKRTKTTRCGRNFFTETFIDKLTKIEVENYETNLKETMGMKIIYGCNFKKIWIDAFLRFKITET